MKNDNQSALDLFNNYSDFALTNAELLAIHGGTSPGGGASDSSNTHTRGGGGGGGDGGGGFTGMAVPPQVMQGIHDLERGARAAYEAGKALIQTAGDIVVTRQPILRDVVVPPRPQA